MAPDVHPIVEDLSFIVKVGLNVLCAISPRALNHLAEMNSVLIFLSFEIMMKTLTSDNRYSQNMNNHQIP